MLKFNNGEWSLVRELGDDNNPTITLQPARSARYVAVARNGFLCIKEVQIFQRQRKFTGHATYTFTYT